jgi:hypothetical protein
MWFGFTIGKWFCVAWRFGLYTLIPLLPWNLPVKLFGDGWQTLGKGVFCCNVFRNEIDMELEMHFCILFVNRKYVNLHVNSTIVNDFFSSPWKYGGFRNSLVHIEYRWTVYMYVMKHMVLSEIIYVVYFWKFRNKVSCFLY